MAHLEKVLKNGPKNIALVMLPRFQAYLLSENERKKGGNDTLGTLWQLAALMQPSAHYMQFFLVLSSLF